MAWCKRDMFEHVDSETGEVNYLRVDALEEPVTTLRMHYQGGKKTSSNGAFKFKPRQRHGGLLKKGFRRISVDPIGQVSPAYTQQKRGRDE